MCPACMCHLCCAASLSLSLCFDSALTLMSSGLSGDASIAQAQAASEVQGEILAERRAAGGEDNEGAAEAWAAERDEDAAAAGGPAGPAE